MTLSVLTQGITNAYIFTFHSQMKNFRKTVRFMRTHILKETVSVSADVEPGEGEFLETDPLALPDSGSTGVMKTP
jgi:hypothetical protein